MPLDSDAANDFMTALRRMRLLQPDERPTLVALQGGVSSDIVRADLRTGPVCIKRALHKLKVKADWQAPVERNRWEVEWMRVVAGIEPDAVPRILGADESLGMFAMAFLSPQTYPLWKARLRDGTIEPPFAAEVGARLARIHAATANNAQLRSRFATDHIFLPIRLEPYLIATGRVHPDLSFRLDALARRTLATHLALIHGDISPKNILCGPRGPVFLDAECAWYGDPAFDLSFCLNHMLLKCTWRPQWSNRYLGCFDALAGAYLESVDWEPVQMLERRSAELLPALFLARVDGKSPVEYINEDWQREAVRRVARRLLASPVDRLELVAAAWRAETEQWPPRTES